VRGSGDSGVGVDHLAAFVELLTDSSAGHVLAQLVGAGATDPTVAAALATHYIHPRRRLAVERLTQAQCLGQIRAGRVS
jgi:hypothetical protein